MMGACFCMESKLIDVKSVKRKPSRFTTRVLAGIGTSLLACAAIAQPADDQAGDVTAAATALDIPESVVMYGQRVPNLRTATALINGEVITQTDVEQRLALVV